MSVKSVSASTNLGPVQLPFEVKIENPTSGKVVYALSHNISDFEIGSDIFSYKCGGYIILKDELSVQLGLDDVPKVGPLEINIKLNNIEYEETFISKSIQAHKTDLSSQDSVLRIDFINLSSVKIDQAFVRCKMDAGVKVSEFLKQKFEDIGLTISSDNWEAGDMKFQDPHFFMGTLSNIIEEIKAMDAKRDTGNLFMCYCDLNGNMCYSEITDKIRKASSDKTKLLLMVTGGTFSSGGILSPDIPASWNFSSTNLDSLIKTSNGFKFYHYNRHKKLMIPSPSKEGMTSIDVLNEVPFLNDTAVVDHSESNKGIEEYMMASAGSDTMSDDYTSYGKHSLSRSIALNDWFNNNVNTIKVGLIDTDLDINTNVGIEVTNANKEEFNKALSGDWLLAGLKHTFTNTQVTSNLYIIRNGIQS